MRLERLKSQIVVKILVSDSITEKERSSSFRKFTNLRTTNLTVLKHHDCWEVFGMEIVNRSEKINTVPQGSYLCTLERQMDWLENGILNEAMPLELMDVFRGLGRGLKQTWMGL